MDKKAYYYTDYNDYDNNLYSCITCFWHISYVFIAGYFCVNISIIVDGDVD